MKRFDIKSLGNEIEMYNDLPVLGGEIYIGDYKEFFLMRIDCWSLEDYRRQWKEAVERLKTHDSSCLVTTTVTVGQGVGFDMFVLYKVKDTIFIQCHSPGVQLTGDDKIIKIPYDTEPCYQLIKPRRVNDKGEGVNVDGQTMWEKKISRKDFMESLPITA